MVIVTFSKYKLLETSIMQLNIWRYKLHGIKRFVKSCILSAQRKIQEFRLCHVLFTVPPYCLLVHPFIHSCIHTYIHYLYCFSFDGPGGSWSHLLLVLQFNICQPRKVTHTLERKLWNMRWDSYVNIENEVCVCHSFSLMMMLYTPNCPITI